MSTHAYYSLSRANISKTSSIVGGLQWAYADYNSLGFNVVIIPRKADLLYGLRGISSQDAGMKDGSYRHLKITPTLTSSR